MQRCASFTKLVLACSICCNVCNAQNNPYKIKDELYGYFLRTQQYINTRQGLSMADTLFDRAKKAGDLKAQCLSYYLKVRHYYSLGEKEKKQEAFRKYAPFILRTPYKQYYFGMRNYFILDYINGREPLKAINELKSYREEAYKYKNEYAISESYLLQGHVYFNQEHFRLALPYYQKALEMSQGTKTKDVAQSYYSIARCYIYLRRWKEAEDAINKYISHVDNIVKSNGYILLLTLYCNEDNRDSTKIESMYHKLLGLYAIYKMSPNETVTFNEAMYNYYKFFKHDEHKAQQYTVGKFVHSVFTDYMDKARYAEAQGDYKTSADYYLKYFEAAKAVNINDEKFLFREFTPQLDYYNLQHEKRLLMQKHAEMELKQLNSNKQLMSLNEEHDHASLITRKKEQIILLNQLQTRKANLERIDRMIANERLKADQQQKAAALINEKNYWRIASAIAFTLVVIISLCIFILDKLKTHKMLKTEKEKAIRSEHIRSLFFQNMNHEIRTPLNAISGFNEILNGEMSKELSSEEKKNFIDMISTNSELLLTLVNDVLDLSNFESGTYKLKMADVDINTLCRTAVESIRGKQKEGVELAFIPPSYRPYTLHTDPQRLQQVLTNYLSNACKHTDYGSIHLSYEIMPFQVRFTVTDTGTGVQKEDAQKVFDRFQMLKGEKSGTGLGLHICRLIANLLNGYVYIDTNYTNGAKFVFDHPIKTLIALFITLAATASPMKANEVTTTPTDRLSHFYKRIENTANNDQSIKMADSLLRMAHRQKDAKLQCVAYAGKTFVYCRSAQPDSMLIFFNKCKALCTKIKYYKPLFDSWEEVVIYYLQKGDFDKAMSELSKFQNMANDSGDKFGIMTYYYTAGNYYAMQKQFAAALNYYLQTVNYDFDDKNSLYQMIGQCYYFLEYYQKAIDNMQMALAYAESDLQRITALVILEKCYCLNNDKKAAIKTFEALERLNKDGFSKAKIINYYAALNYYYKYVKQDREKEIETERIAFSTDMDDNSGRYFYDIGEYKKASDFFKKDAEEYNKWLTSDRLSTQELYISKFDFQQAIKEKDQLKLNNIRLKVSEARNSEKMMALQREKTLWMIRLEEMNAKQKQGEISLQNILLTKRNSELEKQRILTEGSKRAKIISEERARWEMTAILFSLLSIITGVFIYLYNLKRRERRLRQETEDAMTKEKQKEIFFNNLNKEIRQPIDKIININHRLNGNTDDVTSHSERINMVRELNNSTAYLTEFVGDVLDISKMESGTWIARSERCDVNRLCRDVMDSAKKKYPDSELIFLPDGEVNHSPDSICVYTDETLLTTVLTYYISNAVHHSVRQITLAYETTASHLLFSVTDDGACIPEESAENLFFFERNTISDKKDALRLHKIRLIANILNGYTYLDISYTNGCRFVFDLLVDATNR